jgi:hypothetical protein
VTADHLRACRTGCDAEGEWKPWDELTVAERWAYFHELSFETGIVVGGGPVVPTEVP